MKLFGWLRKEKRDSALDQWRNAWAAAIEQGEAGDGPLRDWLKELSTHEADVEIELEMLEALDQLRATQRAVSAGSLPVVDTQHRVIAAESCHFTAPASMATDQAQSTGRVLLTGSRAVFVGAGRTSVTPWHQVHAVARIDRDVVLLRGDRTPTAHFRFNSYADALVCAFLAGQLRPAKRPRL
jgi:hypothetical protein